ncbi:MAG: heparinase II/III family protein, partial [Planctomycetota bacterium]
MQPVPVTQRERDTLRAEGERVDAILGPARSAPTDAQRTDADHAVQGELAFMGGEYVAIGRTDIDWSAPHRQHHCWKGRVLRFQYAPALLRTWEATGEDRYLDALWDFVRDWIRAHPSRDAWTARKEDNMLDLAIRLQHWGHLLGVSAGSDRIADDDLGLAITSVRCQLGYLADHFSPHGNFRIFQAMAMLRAGLVLPFVPEAETWRATAVRLLNDAARRQILADGAHVEVTPSYHSGMTDTFAKCVRLGQAYPDLGIRIRAGSVARMFDYILAHTRPNGSFNALNDSEGIHEGSVDSPWPERRRAFLAETGLPADPPTPTRLFPLARQATFRDSLAPEAEYLVFEASRWGSAHGHLARNNVLLHAYGRSLLLDPGRMEYEMSRPEGPYCKSTRAHNTLNLNGWNQFCAEASDWRAWSAPGYGAAIGRYAGGYWPAPYGW